MRDQLKLVRHYLDQFQPETNIEPDNEIISGGKHLPVKLKAQDLAVISTILKNLQEVGRRAVSEPVGGVREFLTELKDDTNKDASILHFQIERLQKRMKNRAKRKQELDKSD